MEPGPAERMVEYVKYQISEKLEAVLGSRAEAETLESIKSAFQTIRDQAKKARPNRAP